MKLYHVQETFISLFIITFESYVPLNFVMALFYVTLFIFFCNPGKVFLNTSLVPMQTSWNNPNRGLGAKILQLTHFILEVTIVLHHALEMSMCLLTYRQPACRTI